eukprot:909644-Amphidinium_carterae.1
MVCIDICWNGIWATTPPFMETWTEKTNRQNHNEMQNAMQVTQIKIVNLPLFRFYVGGECVSSHQTSAKAFFLWEPPGKARGLALRSREAPLRDTKNWTTYWSCDHAQDLLFHKHSYINRAPTFFALMCAWHGH